MAIAGAVVVPISRDKENELKAKLSAMEGVEVEGASDNGVAIVIEADGMTGIKDISDRIGRIEETLEFNVVYVNWEDEADEG